MARTAIITGASRGIGAAVAERLAKDGLSVVVNYAGSEAEASALVNKITSAGGHAIAAKADVSKADEVSRMFEVAEKYVAFCKQKDLHPVSTAIAWVAAHPAITAPIIGARNVDQLKDSLAAVKLYMTPALRAEIADLSRPPPPATDRSEEQKAAKEKKKPEFVGPRGHQVPNL